MSLGCPEFMRLRISGGEKRRSLFSCAVVGLMFRFRQNSVEICKSYGTPRSKALHFQPRPFSFRIRWVFEVQIHGYFYPPELNSFSLINSPTILLRISLCKRKRKRTDRKEKRSKKIHNETHRRLDVAIGDIGLGLKLYRKK